MKKYNIIYIDPPWDYGNTKNHKGQFWGIADKHYPVMKFKDIKDLPIAKLSAKNCYLFLWITSPFLEKGFELIKEWKFEYSTVAFVWIKMKNDMSEARKDGLGKYTISNVECCLIGKKGKYWREAKNVQQLVFAPKRNHSRKPKEIRERIVKLCGNLPRIELFATEKVKGWSSLGYEINGKDIKNELKLL